MSFLEIAAPLAERGFHVFPLLPKSKAPVAMAGECDHFDASSIDLEQLSEWNASAPNANVGMAPDEIFCFLETDNESELKQACADLPVEIWDTARVSARENRCYYIFRQTSRTRAAGNMTATREGRENLFEFKQYRVYVTGPGSIHPLTGKPYEAQWRNIPAMPDVLLHRLSELYGKPKSESRAMNAETKRQTELLDRFLAFCQVATTGEWFNKGQQWFRPIECPWKDEHENPNEGTSSCIVYSEGGGYGFDCKHRCAGKDWKAFRSELESRTGRKFSFIEREPNTENNLAKDWRSLFHSKQEAIDAPPVRFLIQDFLQREGATAIAAPVRERKSLIALNIVHALLTGEKLFDRFDVIQKPERVLYFCPEVSLGPFTDRVKKIGLLDYVGERFFYRTLSSDGRLDLRDDVLKVALPGSVVFLDTGIRFLAGDENSSEDCREFADTIFALLRHGAEAVVILHHSPKDMGDTMTLENAMRGSGELGAFVACCWGTRLQDPSNPYESASYLENLKQRDFESKPFEVTATPDCRMHMVGNESALSVPPTLSPRRAFKGNRDGRDADAIAFLKANPKLSTREAVAGLSAIGIRRGKTWVSDRRFEVSGAEAN